MPACLQTATILAPCLHLPLHRPPAAYSDRLLVGVPSMARIVSPGRMPAVSAGPPGAGERTTRALVPPCCGEKDTSTPTPVTDPAVLRLQGGSSRGRDGWLG